MTDYVADDAVDLAIDPDGLHRKYEAERLKRMRSDGVAQYGFADQKGGFARFSEDPYVESVPEREALQEDIDALIVGAGFSGQLTAVHLRQAGITNIKIVESGGDFGGTWYWNRYPGVACDVESYVYMPLLEEVGYIPTEKYAKGPEILEYSRMLARHFDLYSRTCFQTQVTGAQWDETAGRWIVETDRGDSFRARFLIVNSGNLNRPRLPGIPGIETFRGHTFHTSRWDYEYTGGDPSTPVLRNLQDKRVGIIGTGATAVQCVPPLGESSKHLYVFQRTPSSVAPRENRPTDPDWVASLKPGWQQERMFNFDKMILGMPQEKDLVDDGWTRVWSKVLVMAKRDGEDAPAAHDPAKVRQLADFEHMEGIRRHIESQVKDPATAEALKPYYNLFCKRPCFHDTYIETFNRPNVTLIDTGGKGVERITENGVVVNGREYEVDCLIYATGFDAFAPIHRAAGYAPVGVGGISLADKWEKGGLRTLHGMSTNGFPNMFMVGQFKQASATVSFPTMLDAQCRHITAILQHCMEHGVRTIQPTKDAEDRWVETVREKAVGSQTYARECTPGYYNDEGQNSQETIWSTLYGDGPFAFMEVIKGWRNSNITQDMAIIYEAKQP